MSKLPAHPDDRWHFFFCEDLGVFCFYEGEWEGEWVEVYVPDLSRSVSMYHLGKGEGAYNLVHYPDLLFPVDLFHKPFVLDPKPSLNMPGWRREWWRRVVSAYGLDPNQALRKFLLALQKGWRASALDWGDSLLNWLMLERDFPRFDDPQVRNILTKLARSR